MSYQETFNDVINTNLTKLPDTPQIKITNPLKKKIYVNSIQLSFDAYFSDKGVVMIKINGNVVLNKNIAGAYSRLQNLPVNLKNQEFNQQGKIEIFVCNGLDTDFVSLGYTIQISEDPNAQIPSNSPLSLTQRNNQLSDPKELFEFRVYSNEIITELINMAGYKKMIVTMSASSIIPPDTESTPTPYSDSFTWTVSWVLCSGNVQSGFQAETINDFDYDTVIDLQYSREQNINFTIGADTDQLALTTDKGVNDPDDSCNGAGNADGNARQYNIKAIRTIRFDVLESDDETFATYDTLFSDKTRAQLVALMPITTTKRYLKIIQHLTNISLTNYVVSSNHQNGLGHASFGSALVNYSIVGLALTNFADELTVGGEASLSFEILGSGNQWIELISSSEFGTVTYGDTVIKQIGDVVSRSGVDKVGFVLPSTQTNFRAKLTVVNAIETGVSIIKVA